VDGFDAMGQTSVAMDAIDDLWNETSRELGLVVDEDSTITAVDSRAARLGLRPGVRLAQCVVTGTEEKAAELCRAACHGNVRAWEIPLVVDGSPVTVLFGGRPHDGGAALLGSRVPQDYTDAVAEENRAMHDIVGLNRELARQKLRLEESNRAIRALHAELEQQADRVRASAEVKGRLVAGVSHEFRTPLHSILGLSRLLLSGSDGPLNSEQQTQVQFIRDSAEELSRMINDVLDLSRLDTATTPLRVETFALREVMSAIRGTMLPLVADDAPVKLVFDPVPDIELETDQGKLVQIVRNLIANALKFTERGVVQVTAAVDVARVSISVRDTGIGIAKADQQRVFEEFTQIEGPLQTCARGTGLGLPLVKRLTELLGGSIEIESEPGVGSRFVVVIPRGHAEVRCAGEGHA
jgi:signal transduction histidine kinase